MLRKNEPVAEAPRSDLEERVESLEKIVSELLADQERSEESDLTQVVDRLGAEVSQLKEKFNWL